MILILVLVAEINLQPQYYTNTNYYYEITGRDSIIYGATNGGVIAFNKQTKGFSVLTNTDGLQMNRQRCLGLDSSGYLWVGNELGLAQVDDMFSAIQIYPIEHLTSTSTQEIVCQRGSVYVGSTGGLLFINTMGTPADFSDDVRMKIFEPEGLPSKNVLTIALDDTSVWVGTDDGLVRFSKDFLTYAQYSTAHGLLENRINKIFIMDTSIYVATRSGLNSFQGTYFDTLLINERVFDINRIGDSLVLALDSISQVGIFHQGSLTVINNGIPYLCRVHSLLNITGNIYCGLGNRYNRDYFGEGIGQYDFTNSIWELTKRPCLPSNHVSDICANEYGVFVACGSRSSDSKGFGWLNNTEEWINFSRDSILPSNHVHRCETAPDGKIWCGMNAFPNNASSVMAFSFDPRENEWFYMYNKYHSIEGTVAVWDIKFDARNNMFLTLAGPSDKVWVIDSAREEVYFLDNEEIGFVVEMAVDSEGRIWQTFVTEDNTLLLIETQNTLFDRSDDIRAEFGLADGLVSTYAYGCIVDSDDNLYVANESGFVIYDGVDFKAMTNVSSKELFDVEMDSEERVWIMARDGLYYYDPKLNILGGWRYYELGVHMEFLAFSNELIQVQGFEFDPFNGCFWLAGETGLLKVAVQYDTAIPLDSILIYPNPVLGKGVVRIKNLPVDALVNIYAVSGRLLIDNLRPDPVFGEVVWYIPNDIGSGLYFALIRSSRYGNKVCKFAIVR